MSASGAAVLASRRTGRLFAQSIAAFPGAARPAGSWLAASAIDLMTTAESSIAGVRGLVPSLNGRAAVSPAAEAAAKTASLTARQALDLFSGATAKLIAGSTDAPSAFDRSLLCATAGLYLSAAASVSTYAAFETREEAFAARATLTGLVDALMEAAAPLSETIHAAGVSAVIRACSSLRARLVADLNEVIGRLPSVTVLTYDRDVDAFSLASHIYGDDASAIEAGYRALVSRNAPRHPAQLPAGPIEVLR